MVGLPSLVGLPSATLGPGSSCRYPAPMIRNVVMVKLRPDHDPAEVEVLQAGFRSLNCPGTLAYTLGSDAGMRPDNWSFAIVADFADEASYRGYDEDAEHNRLRARLLPMAEAVARVQFRL